MFGRFSSGMMKRFIVLCLLTFAGIAPLKAQYQEIGFTGGVSYYIGDLNPMRHFYGYRPTAGIYYRTNLTSRHAFKFNLNIGSFEASDANSKIPFNRNRNLSFRTTYQEIGTQFELNFFDYEIGAKDKLKRFTPYVFFGLSILHFDPKTNYQGNWIELQPLGTEGEGIKGYRKPYSLTTVILPFGAGVKWSVIGRFALGFEWGFRKTFTDYLDDVSGVYADPTLLTDQNGPLSATLADRSLTKLGKDGNNTGFQRGNPSRTDWYVYTGLSLSIRLGNTGIVCPHPY